MKHNKSTAKTAECAESPISSSFVSSDQAVTQSGLLQIIHELPHPMWVLAKNRMAYFNQALADYLGINSNEYDPKKWHELIHAEDQPGFLHEWQTALEQQQGFNHHCRIKSADSSYRMCALAVKFQQSPEHLLHCCVSLTDIHEYFEIQQQLSHTVARQKNMLDASVDGIKLMTPQGEIHQINQPACHKLGIDPELPSASCSWLNLLPAGLKKSGKRALKQAAQGLTSRFTEKAQTANQEAQYWDHLLSPVLDQNNVAQNILCISRNISQQKMAESRLQTVMQRDELTGLYNRNAFYKIFKQQLFKARQQQKVLGLLLIDLDYFRHINDTLSHIAGDHLLQVLGQRFQACFASNTVVARLGGDEFAILVKDLKDEAQLIATAELAYAQLEQPVPYIHHRLNIGMSIGCTVYPRDALNSANLLKCADIALNDLKNSGRGGIRMFHQDMFTSLENMTRQLTLARTIIHADLIIPYYQPKVRLSDGAVIGFEALLRWQDQQQIQLPSQIFSAFQDYGLASRISETMQLKVFADMSRWQEQGLDILPISINAAPVEFLRDDYAEKLLARLSRFELAADKVELEITEQSLSEGSTHYVIRALTLLKQHGMHISLDDFGTGHSSLTRLQEYPVDCIKIDRNFVERMNSDPSALAIVKAITQIGSSISLDVLVEGIENTQQLDTLIGCDCRIGQGFYFYHPMSGHSAQQLLQQAA